MASSNGIKVTGAFLAGAGLVVAGILIYAKWQVIVDYSRLESSSAATGPPAASSPETGSPETSSPETSSIDRPVLPDASPSQGDTGNLALPIEPDGVRNAAFPVPPTSDDPPLSHFRRLPPKVIDIPPDPPRTAPVQPPPQPKTPAVDRPKENTPETRTETKAVNLPAKPSPTKAVTPAATPPQQQTNAPPAPHVVTLQPGSSLAVRLAAPLSTDYNHAGDLFQGTLDSPLIVNGFVIAERGARILGQVTNVQRVRFVTGKADLGLTLLEINTTDGQVIKVDTYPWDQRGSHIRVEDTPKMAVGSAVGAVVGALKGAARGSGLEPDETGNPGPGRTVITKRTVALAAGSSLIFQLQKPITITERVAARTQR